MAIISSIRRPLYENPTFQHRLEHGLSWFLHGWLLAAYVVEVS